MAESFSVGSHSKKHKKYAFLYEAAEKVSKDIQSQKQNETCVEEIEKIAQGDQPSEVKVEEIKKILLQREDQLGRF